MNYVCAALYYVSFEIFMHYLKSPLKNKFNLSLLGKVKKALLHKSFTKNRFHILRPGRHRKMYSFPYIMFSIITINSDHIIEKINLILVLYLYFIQTLISIFH